VYCNVYSIYFRLNTVAGIMNPMERFRANLKVACMSKIEPETWFSEKLANYVRHLASYYQVDAHATVLAVVNGVANTCRSTYINRTSHFLVPCNLFNLVIGRSGSYRFFWAFDF
jgi:hypothetical protein